MTRLGAVALGIALLLGSAGCGDESSTDEASSPASTPASTPASSDTPSESPSESPSDSSESPKDKLAAYAEMVEEQTEDMIGGDGSIYSDFRVEPLYPGGIEYVYRFAKPVDRKAALPAFRKSRRLLRVTFEDQILPELKRSGFKDSKVQWTYLNPDGSEVWHFAAS